MPLNESKGDMYTFITHTWNTVKGRCPHDCSYCYMKQFPQNEMRFDSKELKTDLGKDNFIFVGSSCDMWAKEVPKEWILETLDYCDQFENKYLFQSKNPARILDIINKDYRLIPPDSTIGTTIETNRQYKEMGKAPSEGLQRSLAMNAISIKFETMVTVEPIMDFDLIDLSEQIYFCDPKWVNIGADSKGHNLPEPSADKIKALIDNLRGGDIEVKLKSNLKRLGV